jgi:nicotinamide riboside kinase
MYRTPPRSIKVIPSFSHKADSVAEHLLTSTQLIFSNMKNIYIIGAQSTGKSTLVNALEDWFEESGHQDSTQRPLIIREVAREVLKKYNFKREDIATLPIRALQLQQHILAAQYDAETTACPTGASTWYICDRSGLDPIVYTKYFVGEHAAAEMLASKFWRELENRMKEGVVILCEAGCEWLRDDGVRLMPKDEEEWMHIDAVFRDLLRIRGIRFSTMSKGTTNLEERVEHVKRKIKNTRK